VGIDADGHVGEHPAHVLDVADRLAKCTAVADILRRLIHRPMRQAAPSQGDQWAGSPIPRPPLQFAEVF
jgi:hypothetical protein